MPVNFQWCQSAFEYWPGSTRIFRGASLALLLLGATSFLSFVSILFWLRVQKRRALRNPDSAYHSSPLIFPLYRKVLWCGAAATLIDTICSLFVPTATGLGHIRAEQRRDDEDMTGEPSKLLAALMYGCVWGCYHFVFEGVAFLMLSPGVGTNAARKSAALAAAWAAVTWFVQSWASHNGGSLSSILLSVSWSSALVLFYGALWLLPLSKLFRRPCVYHYARFWCLMRIFTAMSNVLRHYDLSVGFCFYIASTAAFQSPTVAFVVYKCLLRDCQYWLGILSWGAVTAAPAQLEDKTGGDANASSSSASDAAQSGSNGGADDAANDSLLSIGGGGSSNNASMESLRRPLLGTSLAPHSARMLAQKMDSSKRSLRGAARTSALIVGSGPDGSSAPFPGGSPPAKKGGVRVLNFAFLRIDQPVGPGGGAGAAGPNRPQQVVLGSGSSCRVFQGTFRGRPVAIKMIFVPELTPETVASFYHEATLLAQLNHPNVVDVLGVCVLPPAICLVMELCSGGNLFDFLRHAQQNNQPLALWRQLAIASDCAAAVAFLHSQTPAVLHLDIKSLNFLLTKEGRVKIADLELSREIIIAKPKEEEARAQQQHQQQQQQHAYQPPGRQSNGSGAGSHSAGGVTQAQPHPHATPPGSSSGHSAVVSGSELTGFKIPETLYWLAPELIQGLPYSEKADVYALALVVWEIWTASVPYRSLEDSLIVAARSAKFLQLMGVAPGSAPSAEEVASLNHATGGRFKYATSSVGDESGDDLASSHAGSGSGSSVAGDTASRKHSVGSNASAASYVTVATNASERLPGGGGGAWKTAPPAFSSGAAAPAAKRERRYSHSSSRSRRAYEGEEEEMQSTPSSAGSNRSSAPSPQSPRYFLSGAGTGFFGPALPASASVVGTLAGTGGTPAMAISASVSPATNPALSSSPPPLSSQPPRALQAVPTPPVQPNHNPSAGVSALALTRENLISLDSGCLSSSSGPSRPGHGLVHCDDPSRPSSALLAPRMHSGTMSPPVLELEREPDPILAEWKRQHHIITHRIVAHSNQQHDFDSPAASSHPSPAMFGANGSMRGGMHVPVGRQPYSLRPNLPTVPASVTGSLMTDSSFPTASLGNGTPLHLDQGGASDPHEHKEPWPGSPLSEEGSMSASDLSSHHFSHSGIDSALSAANASASANASAIASSLSEVQGSPPIQQQRQQQQPNQKQVERDHPRDRDHVRQPLIQRSAPFSSDLSPIRVALSEPAFTDELSLPPSAFPASSGGAGGSSSSSSSALVPEPKRQFSAPPPSARTTETYQQYTYTNGAGSHLLASMSASSGPHEWMGEGGGEAGSGAGSVDNVAGALSNPSTMPTSRSILLAPSGSGTAGPNEDGSARQSGAPSPTPSQSQRVPRVANNVSLRSTQRRSGGGRSGSSKKKKKRSQGGAHGSGGSGGSADASSRAPGGGAPTGRPAVSLSSIYVSRHDIQSQLRHLICQEHYRPTLPPDMPDELAALLQRAWHPAPHCRPAASEFVDTLARLSAALNEQTQTYMEQHNHAFNNHHAERRNQM